jgi:hypothetical protein
MANSAGEFEQPHQPDDHIGGIGIGAELCGDLARKRVEFTLRLVLAFLAGRDGADLRNLLAQCVGIEGIRFIDLVHHIHPGRCVPSG